jgi:tetratricopeptide (TPR) repeat protein
VASPFVVVSFVPEPDDPAYALYRGGYGAVLGEQWKTARKYFAELQHRYPESAYADDAAYWTAYSWKEEDPEKAATLYRKLLRDFPQSPYLDDAVADLRFLEVGAELSHLEELHGSPVPPHEVRIRLPEELGRLRENILQLRAAEERLNTQRLMVFGEGDTLIIRTLPPLRSPASPPRFDAALQIRMQALQELARSRATGDAFRALREVVLDPRQPAPLRQSAVYSIGTLRRPETGPFLLEIARSDADGDLQRSAIEVYAQNATERGKAVEELIGLFKRFNGSGHTNDVRLGTTLYAIANLGDARATDFLAEVARTHPNEDIRNSAVLYLGSMGTDRSRAALIHLLRGE